MARGLGALALAAALTVASCGGDGGSSTGTTEPRPSTSLAEATTTSRPPATTPVTTGTAAGPVTTGDAVAPVTSASSASAEPTIAPPPPRTNPPSTPSVTLRPDGLGPYAFGAERRDVEPWLTEALGPPETAQGLLYPCARWGCAVEEYLRWPSAGLQVGFADRTPSGDVAAEPVLLAWTVSVDRWFPGEVYRSGSGSGWESGPGVVVRSESGIGLGSTVAELEAAEPATVFLAWNTGTAMPTGFYVPDAAGDAVLAGDVDWEFVSPVQRALNEQGADLVVDGTAGPATLAAILEFQARRRLTDLAATFDELGLVGPAPTARVVRLSAGYWFWELGDLVHELFGAGSPAASITLRPDGLGRFDFGQPANELVDELVAVLGPPDDDTSLTPEEPGPFQYLPSGFWAAYELRSVTWYHPELAHDWYGRDFEVILSDVPIGGGREDATPGVLTLVMWMTGSDRLRLASGLGVGSTVAELRAQHADVVFGAWDVCETGYDPASFTTDVVLDPVWSGLRGGTDWDWVSELQRALNERGASLAVDGEYGPRTRAAVTSFQQATWPDGVNNGLIDPEVAGALGLEVPDEAHVTRLEAGYPGSC